MDNELTALKTIFTEFYYWLTVVLMFFIHVGFCMYEVGASRHKNHMHTLMKNTMLIPLVTITFFFFGWWIYFAFPNGPGIIGGLVEAPHAVPWSEVMGAHMGGADDLENGWARINGVFWAAFLLFSWTAASIVSGSVIERIKSSGFWILAVSIGSVWWVIDAAWGWHAEGWMVQLLGYHDAYASGVIHAIAGGFALGILVVLGPRIGKFAPDGNTAQHPSAQPVAGHDRSVHDLYGILGLLRRVQRADLGHPGRRRGLLLGDQHLLWSDHAFGNHPQLPHVAGRWPAHGLHRLEG